MSRAPFWRATMARRLFTWFALVIAAALIIAGGTSYALLQLGQTSTFSGRLERGGRFLGARLERVWDDPEQRAALLDDLSTELEVDLRLEGPQGAELAQRGPPTCPRRPWTIPVRRDDQALGELTLCPRRPSGGPTRLLLTLAAVAVGLWAAAWALSRDLTRPLRELAEVARRLGDGDLSERAEVAGRAGGEIEALGRAINEMAGRIEQQLREQRTLLAAVSHELRTPLGHLRLLAQMGQERGLTPKQWRELHDELVEMDDLVDQLLATSRLNFELGDQRELDVTDLLVGALERADVDPTALEIDADAPSTVRGDATLLARALANLLGNATRHGGGPTRVHMTHRGGAPAVLVEDAGPGLPGQARQRLFEPFVQGEHDTRGSLGLGLFLVRRIARAHGGEIVAEDREGGGARVGFTLRAS